MEVKGTVLDARTHNPIKGAKVVQSEDRSVDSPKTRSRTSDAAGHFRLKASSNFHLAIAGVGEGHDWPPEHYYLLVTISHPNYLAYEIRGLGGARDVMLQPVDGLELRGRVLDARTKAPILAARVYLDDYTSLSCISDATGHFLLKAPPEFYQRYSASEASGHPFRDWVTAEHGGWISFHWADPEGPHTHGSSENMLIQLDQ